MQMRVEQIYQRDSNHDVDHRPGNSDQKLLPRFFGNALELRHAADRQQRYVRCWYAESARGEYVAEFVQQHAEKKQDHKSEAVPGRGRTAGGVASGEDPG